MNVVWFKRDLRVTDHKALASAASSGIVVPLYILEPELWKQPDVSCRHFDFLKECLISLRGDLQSQGLNLVIKVGDAVEVLQAIHERRCIKCLWSHQETWNGWSYRRDIRVRQWAKTNNIQWKEPAQNGVVRNLSSRNGWSMNWNKEMRQPLSCFDTTPATVDEVSEPIPTPKELGILQLLAQTARQADG